MKFIRTLAIGIGVSVGALVAYWAADRETPSQNAKTHIVNPVVTAGGIVTQHIDVNRVRLCNIQVHRILYDNDGTRFILPAVSIRVPGNLGKDVYNQEISIPGTMSKGKAILRVITEWQCNPVHYFFPIRSVVDYEIEIV